jgi:hypothetical protein
MASCRNLRELSLQLAAAALRKTVLLTIMRETIAMTSYGHSRHANGAWAGPMALPRAWE